MGHWRAISHGERRSVSVSRGLQLALVSSRDLGGVHRRRRGPGLLRCIGFLRFSLIAPQLSHQYVHPASPAAKEAARTGWLIVNAVVGEIVGDLLAFGLSAVFVAGIAYTIGRTMRFSRPWAIAGQILSVYGLLELATFVVPKPLAGIVGLLFPLSYAASILWFGATGLRLYLRRSASAVVPTIEGELS